MKSARELFAATGRSDSDTLRVADLIAYDDAVHGSTTRETTTGGEGGGATGHRQTGSGKKSGRKSHS